jgi:hypothetical protein
MRINFDEPETYEQIEAVGAAYKAMFRLAQAYNIEKPGDLIKESKWNLEYRLGELLEAQQPKTEVAPAVDAVPEDLLPEPSTLNEDPGVDLSNEIVKGTE